MIRGHFLRRVSYLPHVKEPVTNGHLSCRDMFSGILRCPLKTGLLYAVYRPQSPQCSIDSLIVSDSWQEILLFSFHLHIRLSFSCKRFF